MWEYENGIPKIGAILCLLTDIDEKLETQKNYWFDAAAFWSELLLLRTIWVIRQALQVRRRYQ